MNDSSRSLRTRREGLAADALQEALFGSAGFSTIATDARGVIQFFNAGAERMLGYAAADVVDKITPADISDPEELIARAMTLSAELDASIAPGFDALVFKASRGIEDIYELTYFRNDGSRFPALVSATALRDARGAIIGYLLIGTDNTARKRVEEERETLDRLVRSQQIALRRKDAELEAAWRLNVEPLARMARAFRAPVNAVIGCSEALKDGLAGAITEQQRRFVGEICGSGRHLLSLVDEILELSRVEAGTMELALGPAGASPLENGLAGPWSPGAPSGTFALVVEDDDKAAALIRIRLEAEGFRVLHAASAEGALALAARQPIALLTLDVMLPGMGGWELLSRIRGMPSLRRVPVVIISIVPDTRKGFALGATAVLQKPVSREELHDALGDLGLFPLAEGRPLTVLVVDDDPRAVELVAVRMAGLASNVLRAYGGREAIAAARREIPDLIVLDLVMPKVNGFDVVEALHDTPETAGIPILVVTAREITAEDRARLNGSVAAIMEKATFDAGRFTAEVRRAMAGRQAAA